MKKQTKRAMWALATFALFLVLALAFVAMGAALWTNPAAGAAIINCAFMAIASLVVGAFVAFDMAEGF